MTIRLHRGDLPDLSRYSRRGRDRHRDHGSRSAPRPALRGAAVARRRLRRCGADRRRTGQGAPNLKRLLADPAILKIFHFARFDSACSTKRFGVMPAPVYCTKIASRLARTYTDKHGLKDLVREAARRRSVEAAAIVRLGRRRAHRRAARLRGLRRAASARAQGQARRHAGARRPRGACRRLLPLPARPGPARSRRLGRRGHFRAFGVSYCIKAVFVEPWLPRRGHIRASGCLADGRRFSAGEMQRSQMPILARTA